MTYWAYKFSAFLSSYVAQSFVIVCPFLERSFSYTCGTFSFSLKSSLKCYISLVESFLMFLLKIYAHLPLHFLFTFLVSLSSFLRARH